jgi:hypothetical protein
MAGIEASVLATGSVNSATSAAEFIAAKLPSELSRTAVRLYTALCGAAIETACAKGYSANVTHMVIHAPLEQVARAVGISRVSAWRHLPALKSLGVLDYRTHKGTCRGLVRNTGTVFMIRLNPSSGSKCRLSYQDLKHKWRDLQRDCKAGRTSYRALKHTKASPTNQIQLSVITDWTLPVTDKAPVKVCMIQPSSRVDLAALLDVRFAAKQERSKAVDTAARALAQGLADTKSLNFYRLLVWRCLRANQRGLDYFQQVYQMALRVQRADIAEGWAVKGGAVFVSRLKQTGLLDELMQT